LDTYLDISWGLTNGMWVLDMVGRNDSPLSLPEDDSWFVFPLCSNFKQSLEALAHEYLPKLFVGEKFYVISQDLIRKMVF